MTNTKRAGARRVTGRIVARPVILSAAERRCQASRRGWCCRSETARRLAGSPRTAASKRDMTQPMCLGESTFAMPDQRGRNAFIEAAHIVLRDY
ncbi:hypothetical protein [Burkholderia plantarii]|uniref:hypothetical protein n=1 Tax=Burkholderia plantarii TaxID=41899 RepID=UPI00272994C3|nr:hypothetical protein [Burkholderia plantarii]